MADITLPQLVDMYLQDEQYIQERREKARKRDASLPQIRAVIDAYTQRKFSFDVFRVQLNSVLERTENWGATGFGFMMELNKFQKHHVSTNPKVDESFRQLLIGLNHSNMGERIEKCYHFLLSERERLYKEGKKGSVIVPPSRSTFMISLFARWLDPVEDAIIYYESSRKGLFYLVQQELLPLLDSAVLSTNNIEVRNNAQHQAIVKMLHYIEKTAPKVNTYPYWTESFCKWIIDTLLASSPKAPPTSSKPPKPLLPRIEFLQPTPEPLLTTLIREVQRHMLIDEKVIRRIYHALLAGHVILTGPPGTGKTELARYIPEILWRSRPSNGASTGIDEEDLALLSTESAFTTQLVTATDEWNTRTLISGIVPAMNDGQLGYTVQYGHLTTAILKNWHVAGDTSATWNTQTLQRARIQSTSVVERGIEQTFKGLWLIIDEFNRAPIDLALGEALTALGGSNMLRVGVENGSAELPIPHDFRIIGTLNSFDRHYLNQISEALKRRFSFIEILPPTRQQRDAEQSMVLYKALKSISHLSTASIESNGDEITWQQLSVTPIDILWRETGTPIQQAFEAGWRLFEVLRMYRQLGTAQAISLFRHMLIAGILQGYTTREEWLGQALDEALCDTIADQLQVLLPDEIEVLLLYLTTEASEFAGAYQEFLLRLTVMPQRLYGQLLALTNVYDEKGEQVLSDKDVEKVVSGMGSEKIAGEVLEKLFYLGEGVPRLPQFTRRLRAFKVERGV